MPILTPTQINILLAANPQADLWLDPLNMVLPTVGIDNPYRLAAFISQTSHESADYTRLRENLNYSAKGLVATWPTRFNITTAAQYARQPEKIANKVYANRLGNGSEDSGDGWKFRGRGILQITGKSNYATCSAAIFGDYRLLTEPEQVELDKLTSVKTACWFWNRNFLNELADNGYITEITKKINGGYHGLNDRIARYNKAKIILGIQ